MRSTSSAALTDAPANFTYAEDAAQAAWLALTAPHLPRHLYNAAADRRPIRDFNDALQQLPPPARITVSDAETPTNPHPPMNYRRRREDLGFAPHHTLTSGLQDFIEGVRAFDRYAERRRVSA